MMRPPKLVQMMAAVGAPPREGAELAATTQFDMLTTETTLRPSNELTESIP